MSNTPTTSPEFMPNRLHDARVWKISHGMVNLNFACQSAYPNALRNEIEGFPGYTPERQPAPQQPSQPAPESIPSTPAEQPIDDQQAFIDDILRTIKEL